MGREHVPTSHNRLSSTGSRRSIQAEAVALLHMAQAGDREAFGQLYTNYALHVRRYVAVRLYGWERDAVPDLVHDTFTAALEELDRAHDDVEGWLIQLAAKMCTRHVWRHRRYLRAALTSGEQQRLRATGNPTAASTPAIRTLITQAMAALGPRERLTLQLRFLDGLDHESTARIMNCSVWTVRQRQRRALRHLAAQLGTELNALATTSRLR